jgi:hypothetical protein
MQGLAERNRRSKSPLLKITMNGYLTVRREVAWSYYCILPPKRKRNVYVKNERRIKKMKGK